MSTTSASPPSLRIRKTRKRATTRALLGDDYPTDFEAVPDFPKPLKSLEDYDEAQLKQRLLYAETLLHHKTRRPSPIGEKCLAVYKDACAQLLDLVEAEKDDIEQDEVKDEIKLTKKTLASQLVFYERGIGISACLQLTRSESVQKHQEALVELLQSAFYARYGDYLQEVCKQLKSRAEAFKVPGYQLLQKAYWTDVLKRLEDEDEAHEATSGKDVTARPTRLAVHETCIRIGISTHEMLVFIKQYAIRNSLLHSNIAEMTRDGKFDAIKHQLYKDYCDVPKVISMSAGFEAAVLSKLLSTMIGEWFVFGEEDMDNPEAWAPSEKLRAYRKELMSAKPPHIEDMAKMIHKEIVNAFKKREAEKTTEDMVRDVEALEISDPRTTPAIKRVASSEFEAAREQAMEQRRRWMALVNVSMNVRNLSERYLNEFGELEAPPEIVDAGS